MLTKRQLSIFESKTYGVTQGRVINNNIDYADYSTIKTKHCGHQIVMSGWMSPHDDIECQSDEIWTIQVLAVCEDDVPVLVHELSSGKIVGHTLKVGGFYSFLFARTHALLPKEIALDVVDQQDWDIKKVNDFLVNRKQVGYMEKAQLAWYFIDSTFADITQNN